MPKQEIALVAARVGGAVQRTTAARQCTGGAIVPGGEGVGAEIARRLEKVGELHLVVAGGAGDRRLAGGIGGGEGRDHLLAEAGLVVEHVVRDAEPGRHGARVADVAAGAARAGARRRAAIVVEPQRHADDVVAFGVEQRGHHRRVDAARHGDDDSGLAGRLGDVERVHGIRPMTGMVVISVLAEAAQAEPTRPIATLQTLAWAYADGRR